MESQVTRRPARPLGHEFFAKSPDGFTSTERRRIMRRVRKLVASFQREGYQATVNESKVRVSVEPLEVSHGDQELGS